MVVLADSGTHEGRAGGSGGDGQRGRAGEMTLSFPQVIMLIPFSFRGPAQVRLKPPIGANDGLWRDTLSSVSFALNYFRKKETVAATVGHRVPLVV